MQFVEFLDFIGRIAHECFLEHPELKELELHFKIDALLTKLLKIVKLNKTFTYLEPDKQNMINEVTKQDKENKDSVSI